MKKASTVCVLALLLLSSVCLGQTITLPKEVTGNPGNFIEVKSTTDGDIVKWVSLNPNLNVFPIHLLKDSKTAVVTASRSGRYELIAYTAKDNVPSDPARTVVIVGNPGPDPDPDPDPDPEPDPDDPLSPLAKNVRDLAKKVGNKVESGKLAENYATSLSAINAGAYDSLSFIDARAKIVGDVFEMNKKITQNNEEWNIFFKALGTILTELDKEGKIKTVKDIKAIFEQIQIGLEAS